MSVQDLFGSDPEDEDADAESAFHLSLATASPGVGHGQESSPSGENSPSGTPAASSSESGSERGGSDEDDDGAASLDGRVPASSFALSLDDAESFISEDEHDDSSVKSEKVNGAGKTGVTVQDLFGEADDISSSADSDSDVDSRKEKSSSARRPQPVAEDNEDQDGGRGFMMDDEDDEEQAPEEPQASTLEADIPVFPSLGGEQIFFVKLPNFLSVEARAFDPDVYEEEVDEDELLDEEGRTRLKLKLENTMRWRYAKDPATGKEHRESNARIVKWSDGSASLLLGSEVFDIHQTQLVSGDYSHLFVQQGTGLQGQAVFRSKLSFRPHSTDSRTHRKMTMSIADRFSKTQKIRVLPIAGKDPELQRAEMLRKEEERLRSAIRLENRQRRQRERSHAQGRLSKSFLEHRDDDDETSLSAIKRSFSAPSRKPPAKRKPPPSRPAKRKSSATVSSDDEAEIDDDDDEDDEGEDLDEDDDDEEEEDDEEDEEDDGFIDDTVEGNESGDESEEAPPSPAAGSRKRSRKDSDASQSKKKKKLTRSKMVISSSDEDSDD